MKKLLTLTLAIIMTLSLAACGGSDAEPSSTVPTSSSQPDTQVSGSTSVPNNAATANALVNFTGTYTTTNETAKDKIVITNDGTGYKLAITINREANYDGPEIRVGNGEYVATLGTDEVVLESDGNYKITGKATGADASYNLNMYYYPEDIKVIVLMSGSDELGDGFEGNK